jgi:hypothetical protein
MTDDPDEPIYSHPDPQHSPPHEVLRDVAVILRSSLPPPAADTPEGKARRDRAAMAAVASLQPANAAEGRLAAQFVALDTHSLDCLRLARERHDEPEAALKCIAQATSMMREGKGALGLLLKLQARRRASAKNAAAANRAAWAEYDASEMMKDAMSATPLPAALKAAGPDTSNLRPASDIATNTPKTSAETTARPRPSLAWSNFGKPGGTVHRPE